MDSSDLAPLAVAAAINAAGPQGPNWRNNIRALIPMCAAMLDEHSPEYKQALQVLEAQVWTGVYLRHEIEESSTRAIVTLAKNAEGETETIRTNRTDRADGRAIVDRLVQLESGDEIRVWKAIEEMSGRADRKVRVMVHFQKTYRNASGETPPPTARQQVAAAPPVESPAPPAAPASNVDPRVTAIRENIGKAKNKALVVASLKLKGWSNAADIPEDKLDLALYMSLHEGEEPF